METGEGREEIQPTSLLSGEAEKFRNFVASILGFKNRKPFKEELKRADNLSIEERQLYLKDKILASLRKKGILASPGESREMFKGEFRLSAYSAPEQFLECPGGRIVKDNDTGEIKIFLNPYLDMFKPDYQLLTVLEEAIHWSQLKKGLKGSWREEVAAAEKLLRLKEYLGLSAERIDYLRKVRNARLQETEEKLMHKFRDV